MSRAEHLYHRIMVGLLFTLLALPLLATLLYALSSDWSNTILPQGYSLKWFIQLWSDPRFLTALGHSLLICLGALLFSLVLVLPAMFVIAYYFPRLDAVMNVLILMPFALPPVVRLTVLGIKQVPADLIEAAESFGANPRQMLFKVQLPLAMPTIMAGINQTLMLALSMVVIASMIAVGGLGQMVLRGIGRLDMGLATVGGVGIVILAIILDRLTQSLGRDRRSRGNRRWYATGPLGLLTRPFIK